MTSSAELRTTAYRAFVVNDKGHLGGLPQIIEACDDLDAARQAETLAGWNAVELWEGARLVARVAPPCRNAASTEQHRAAS